MYFLFKTPAAIITCPMRPCIMPMHYIIVLYRMTLYADKIHSKAHRLYTVHNSGAVSP